LRYITFSENSVVSLAEKKADRAKRTTI